MTLSAQFLTLIAFCRFRRIASPAGQINRCPSVPSVCHNISYVKKQGFQKRKLPECLDVNKILYASVL